jgi:hypothetical protein
MAKRVKVGFVHEKVFYKAGVKVSDELARLYPESVKDDSALEVVVEEVFEQPKEEKVEEKKTTKKKTVKKAAKK